MDRVAIVGCIGAGKSVLARALGERLQIEVTHLDRLWWQDGHYVITGRKTVQMHTLPPDEFRQVQEQIIARERWVIDGGADCLDLRLARADTVVFLDLPLRVCAWRVVTRQGNHRADYPPNVGESWRWTLRLVRWVLWTYPRHRRAWIEQMIATYASEALVVRVRRPEPVEVLVDRVVVAGGAPNRSRQSKVPLPGDLAGPGEAER